jgi:hypothetical protein
VASLDGSQPRDLGLRGSNADGSNGYYPKKLGGCIMPATGGDGSNYGKGTFREGAVTIGNLPDSVDDKIQANIVAAGD